MAEYYAVVNLRSEDPYIRSAVRQIAYDLIEKTLRERGFYSYNIILEDPEFLPPYARVRGKVYVTGEVDPERDALIEREFRLSGGTATVTLELQFL